MTAHKDTKPEAPKSDAAAEKSVAAIEDEVASNMAKELEQGYRGVTPDGPADIEYSLLSGPDGPPIHTETIGAINAKEAKNG